MCFRENDDGGSKREYKGACECSILYTAHPMIGISLKVINVLLSKNLALLTINSIQNILKNIKNRNSDT